MALQIEIFEGLRHFRSKETGVPGQNHVTVCLKPAVRTHKFAQLEIKGNYRRGV